MQHTNTLYSLQILRFFAAVLVLLFHLEWVKSGYKGVDIFFVISGFVMYYTTFILPSKNAASFIINRLTKIYFMYWTALLLLYIIVPFQINYAFLKTFFLVPGHASLLGVSWSLSYELYFYFLFCIAIYLLPKKYSRFIFILLFIISSFITLLNTTPCSIKGSTLNFLSGSNLWEFLLGILCAFLYSRLSGKINSSTAAIICFISLLALTGIHIPYMNPYSYIVYGILSFMLILFITITESQVVLNKIIAGLFKTLGDASYAIYLLAPVFTMAILPKSAYAKILVILLTIISSIFINKVVENNVLSIGRNYLRKKITITP